ncbi:MAG TPA: helix-turn-helix domain-containing protein [Solirubrobacteraceae bacterium]|jgi:AcrR family transcriptional regulator
MAAAPPRRTQAERRAQTRAKLLKAAGAVFARRGYHEATLDEIAERAGLSKGALYYNFASKEDLFLALLADRLAERLGEAAGAGPRAFEAFVAALERDPRWAPLFFEFVAWSGRDSRRRAQLRERFIRPAREHTRAVLAADASPFTPEELAIVVNALVNGLLLERLFDPEGVPADLVTRALLVLTGAEFARPADG